MTEYGLNYRVSDRIALTDGSGTRFHGIDFFAETEAEARTKALALWNEVKAKYGDEVSRPSLDRLHPMPEGGSSFEPLSWSPVLN